MAGWCIELAWPPPAADGLAWRGPRLRLGVFNDSQPNSQPHPAMCA